MKTLEYLNQTSLFFLLKSVTKIVNIKFKSTGIIINAKTINKYIFEIRLTREYKTKKTVPEAKNEAIIALSQCKPMYLYNPRNTSKINMIAAVGVPYIA